MKIIKTYSWNRRDFSYDAECEACKHVECDVNGYDDAHYYNEVLPDKKCPECGHKSRDNVKQTVPIAPRHNENITL